MEEPFSREVTRIDQAGGREEMRRKCTEDEIVEREEGVAGTTYPNRSPSKSSFSNGLLVLGADQKKKGEGKKKKKGGK